MPGAGHPGGHPGPPGPQVRPGLPSPSIPGYPGPGNYAINLLTLKHFAKNAKIKDLLEEERKGIKYLKIIEFKIDILLISQELLQFCFFFSPNSAGLLKY